MSEVIRGYMHDALFYESDEEMVASAAPFLRAALDGYEVAVLACADRNASLLAEALHRDPRIGILDRSEVYRRVPDCDRGLSADGGQPHRRWRGSGPVGGRDRL